MKYNPVTHFLSSKDCPYTVHGKNIAELRRAKLRKIALSIEVDAEGSKNDILGRVIARLRAMHSEKELSER